MANARPTVLVVDDEVAFVASLAETSARRPEAHDLVVAHNGREAIDILEQRSIDLVVTDLSMPVLDGWGLLAWMAKHRSSIPVIVLTAFGTPEVQSSALTAGALRILDKPVSRTALREAIHAGLAHPKEAHMSGIGLPSVLQLLALDRKDCSVTTRGPLRGRLDVVNGRVVDAEYGELRGDDAAFALVSFGADDFTLEPLPALRKTTIDLTVEQLLIEAARRADEASLVDPPPLAHADYLQVLLEPSTVEESAPSSSTGRIPRGVSGVWNMPNIKESLEKCGKIEGAMAAALVDYKSGMTLGVIGGSAAFNIEVAASSNTEVVRAKMKAMGSLHLKDKIEDILITLSSQYHIIRMLDRHPDLFLYLALSRENANLAVARMKLGEVERALEL
jgi:CheY-like chemotaxis protein